MNERALPAGRWRRLSGLGRIAGGIAGDVLAGATRSMLNGAGPTEARMLVSADTAKLIADRLSEMRGAAMKIGQLLSMDGGFLLPEETSRLLASLRQQAYRMPLGDVARVLDREWGPDWSKRFQRFHFTPLAAASIGQVHSATLESGQRLAIKVQFPGVRESIDGDVDNIALLLRVSGLLPPDAGSASLFDEAKAQLRREADYLQERQAIERFAALIGDDPRYRVPEVDGSLSTESVLAMEFLDGAPVEELDRGAAVLRSRVAESLFVLSLTESMQWGYVQTDPNFANYKVDLATGQLQLLDFGAVREYAPERRLALRALLSSAMDGSATDLAEAAAAAGYLDGSENPSYRDAVVGLLQTAAEPLRSTGQYDFGNSSLASRMANLLRTMRNREKFQHIPPVDILFLHRRLGGLYLLLSRLKARLPARSLAMQVMDSSHCGTASVVASGTAG